MCAELTAEKTDYGLLAGVTPPGPPLFATLEALLRANPAPLTRQELLARWTGPAPRPDTLWRALAGGVLRGLFVARGAGTRADPLRYGLPGEGPPPELQIQRAVWPGAGKRPESLVRCGTVSRPCHPP